MPRAHSKVGGVEAGEDEGQRRAASATGPTSCRRHVAARRAPGQRTRGQRPLQRGHERLAVERRLRPGRAHGRREARGGRARRRRVLVASIISPMGVMPAIVSLEKGKP